MLCRRLSQPGSDGGRPLQICQRCGSVQLSIHPAACTHTLCEPISIGAAHCIYLTHAVQWLNMDRSQISSDYKTARQ